MKKVERKVRGQRKKFEKQVTKLEKFKMIIQEKELKKLGIRKETVTKSEYNIKINMLNTRFAQGVITRSQWTRYTTVLRQWVTISRRSYRIRVRKLKKQVQKKVVSVVKYKKIIKILKKRRVPAKPITVVVFK
jgi:hypothetical protein